MQEGVLVSTPDLRPSLLSVLPGLAEIGLLQHLVTTLAFESEQIRSISKIPIIGPRLEPALRRRRLPPFLAGKASTIWPAELARLLATKLTAPEIAHGVWNWAERRFDRLVARKFGGRFKIIYGMEHASAKTFCAQKAVGGLSALRQVTAHPRTLSTILRNESSKFPEYVTAYHRRLLDDEQKITARKEEEYRLADIIIANSHYVRSSFIENGVNPEKVFAVPTGCPPVERSRARSGRTKGQIRFLFVGTVSLRKGFPYLLKAWRQANLGGSAELLVAGGTELNILAQIAHTPGIRYLGVLTKGQLREVYRKCDILVLPSLAEGLAHSVLEGLSFGLPVITTMASGAGNLVLQDENGFVVPEGNVEALSTAISHALSAREQLPRMGDRSAERAAGWSVAHSNAEHLRIFRSFCERTL
jgi:glycosyltransferase involved in cell wall biosynthesis